MTATHSEEARSLFQAMLNGAPPPATLPELNGWRQLADALVEAYHRDGTPEVRRVYDVASRTDRNVARLISTRGMDPTPQAAGCPPLPAAAQAIYDHAAPCGAWLDDYIAFAQQAAPMTPRSFHEAAGLFAVAVAVARRICIRTGTGYIFPNLFALQIAPPALYKKTTGLNIMAELLERAGVDQLLLPHSVTPQGLMGELSLSIPADILGGDPQARDLWLEQRAFAAQRGWLLDEAAGLFDSLQRDYNTNLINLVLQLFDCSRQIKDRTAGRGLVSVERAYLSLLGATTPDAIRKHLNDREIWGRGLWSRVALVAPDGPPVYAPHPPAMRLPHDLILGLRRVFELFELPRAYLDEPEGEGKRPSLRVVGGGEPVEAVLAPGVEAAFDTYNRTVGFEMLRQRGAVEALFHSYYDRLALQARKVALLLAVLDATPATPVTVELAHVARAVETVERWRAGLHRIWLHDLADDDVEIGDRIMDQLAKAAGGLTARELCQLTHRKAAAITAGLDLLEKAGRVESEPIGRRVIWRSAQSVASVANRSNGKSTPSQHSNAPNPKV